MTRTVTVRAAGLALGFFLVSLGVADDKKTGADPGDLDLAQVTDQTARQILDALKGTPDDKARERARTAAVVLATVAQVGPGSPAQRATVQSSAVQLADAIRRGELEEARKKAASLVKLTVDPMAKINDRSLLGDRVTFREAMLHFGRESSNGTDGEKKLLGLARNEKYKRLKALPAKEMTDELLALAYRAAALGALSKDHNDATVKKAPKDWQRHAEETRRAALDLATAVRGRKGDAAWTALNRLNSACYECHSQFGR